MFILTFKSVIVPETPETTIFEGYGLPTSATSVRIVIGVEFVKVVVVCAKAARLKTAKIKTKLLKKDKVFIFLLEKLKLKVFGTEILLNSIIPCLGGNQIYKTITSNITLSDSNLSIDFVYFTKSDNLVSIFKCCLQIVKVIG